MKELKKYGITLLAGFAIVALILFGKDFFSQTDLEVIFHILSDAFFVSGVVITAVGLLVFSSNEGTFDMLVYGMDVFADFFRKKSRKKAPTYYDYKEMKAGKKIRFGFLVISGLFFLAIAFAMYLFYRRYSG